MSYLILCFLMGHWHKCSMYFVTSAPPSPLSVACLDSDSFLSSMNLILLHDILCACSIPIIFLLRASDDTRFSSFQIISLKFLCVKMGKLTHTPTDTHTHTHTHPHRPPPHTQTHTGWGLSLTKRHTLIYPDSKKWNFLSQSLICNDDFLFYSQFILKII